MIEQWEDLEKAQEAFTAVAKAAKTMMESLVEVISPIIHSFCGWWNDLIRSHEDLVAFMTAKKHQLVSERVLTLACRKGKVGKKNMARIRKEVKRYERHAARRCM